MTFINIDDVSAIKKLRQDEFALPTMIEAPNRLLADTPRLQRSIKGMQTIMIKSDLRQIAALMDVSPGLNLPQQMQELEKCILKQMRVYGQDPSPLLLVKIFHMVQLWGGIAGRNIYLQDGGFDKNWNSNAYQQFVQASVTPVGGPGADPRVPCLIKAAGQIKQFGVAFATKHARFWAEAAEVQPLPIYDRIMARGCLGKTPSWNDYDVYVAEMAAHAQQVKTDVATLERNAFTQFDTPEGKQWLEARK